MEEGKAAETNSTRTKDQKESQTLIVKNLNPSITSQRLYDFFTDKNFSVVNAKIRLSSKDYSNVFGVVKFCSEAEAQKALDTFNKVELDGYQMVIEWFNSKLMAKDREQANIYVKFTSLTDQLLSITEDDLNEWFEVYGTIVSAKPLASNGQSTNDAYVQFEDKEAASRAIEGKNGTEWKGCKLFATEYKKHRENRDKQFKNNLYCKNFPSSYNEDDLSKLFEEYGTVTSIVVKTHKDDMKQAFVWFDSGEQANAAKEALNGKQLEGCNEKFFVTELLSKNERRQENINNYKKIQEKNLVASLAQNLYVSGIPKSCTKDEIEKEFEQFGPIRSIKLNEKPSFHDKNKIEFIGSAYVCFEDAEDARKAVYHGNMNTMFGKSIFVDYYKPKQVKAKEKIEEFNVAMKQLMHGFMMTAMAQSQGMGNFNRGTRGKNYRGSGHRGGAFNNRGHYPRPSQEDTQSYYHMNASMRPGFSKPPPIASRPKPSQSSTYAYGSSTSNPLLPQPSTSSTIPSGPPISGPPIGSSDSVSSPPVGRAPYGVLPPAARGVLPSMPPPIGGLPMSTPPVQIPPPQNSSNDTIISKEEIETLQGEDLKNHIGENIYPIIEEKYGNDAPKITGMIIDMEKHNLISTLESKTNLLDKAEEAYQLLVDSGAAEN